MMWEGVPPWWEGISYNVRGGIISYERWYLVTELSPHDAPVEASTPWLQSAAAAGYVGSPSHGLLRCDESNCLQEEESRMEGVFS